MKRKEIMGDAVGRIDDKFLEEADLYNRTEKERNAAGSRRRIRLAEILAAASVIVLLTALIVIPALVVREGGPAYKGMDDVSAADDGTTATSDTEPADIGSDVIWSDSAASGDFGEILVDFYTEPRTLENGNVVFENSMSGFYEIYRKADDDDVFAVFISGSATGDDYWSLFEENEEDLTEFQKAFSDFTEKKSEMIERLKKEKNINGAETSVRIYDDPGFIALRDEFYKRVYDRELNKAKTRLPYESELIGFISDHSEKLVCRLGDESEGALAYLGQFGLCIAEMTKEELKELDDGEYKLTVDLAYRDYDKLRFEYYGVCYSDVDLPEDGKLTRDLLEAYNNADGKALRVKVHIGLPDREPDEFDKKYDERTALWERACAHFGMTYDEFERKLNENNDPELYDTVHGYKESLLFREEEQKEVNERIFRDGETVEWQRRTGYVVADLTYERAVELSEVWEVAYIELHSDTVPYDPFSEVLND